MSDLKISVSSTQTGEDEYSMQIAVTGPREKAEAFQREVVEKARELGLTEPAVTWTPREDTDKDPV